MSARADEAGWMDLMARGRGFCSKASMQGGGGKGKVMGERRWLQLEGEHASRRDQA
jgi:hypothetical protein